jgi:hypothetical protein
MNSFEGAFECDADAGVTVPSSCEPCGTTRRSLRPGFCVPEPLGVNVAAAAAFGDMPIFLACATAGCAASVLGVKEGDSTLKDFFGLCEKSQHVANGELGRRGTDMASPFAGVIADEKSWLKGQVPGSFDELQCAHTITRGTGSNLLETSYKAVHSCMVLRGLQAGGSQSGWNPKGSAASHLQTSAERPRPYHSGPDAC